MNGLVLLLVLSNLAWFTAYWITRHTKRQAGNRIATVVHGQHVEIQGYSGRETLSILDAIEKRSQQ